MSANPHPVPVSGCLAPTTTSWTPHPHVSRPKSPNNRHVLRSSAAISYNKNGRTLTQTSHIRFDAASKRTEDKLSIFVDIVLDFLPHCKSSTRLAVDRFELVIAIPQLGPEDARSNCPKLPQDVLTVGRHCTWSCDIAGTYPWDTGPAPLGTFAAAYDLPTGTGHAPIIANITLRLILKDTSQLFSSSRIAHILSTSWDDLNVLVSCERNSGRSVGTNSSLGPKGVLGQVVVSHDNPIYEGLLPGVSSLCTIQTGKISNSRSKLPVTKLFETLRRRVVQHSGWQAKATRRRILAP